MLGKIPFGEFLTSGEYELKAECQVCYLQVSKGEMDSQLYPLSIISLIHTH